MPILETTSAAVIPYITGLFAALVTGGVADTSVRMLNNGQGLLAQTGLSETGQYGVAGVSGAIALFLGKMVLSYHERLLSSKDAQIADRDRQIVELHARVTALEARQDKQSQAILEAGLAPPPPPRESRAHPRVFAD